MPRKPVDLSPAGLRKQSALVEDEARHNSRWVGDDLPPKETRGDKKRRATQLEVLGESLVKLPASKLARVPMPDDLKAAVMEARRITARGGYRRAVQFIGRIMRSLDARPIAAALESMKGEDAPSARAFQEAELWRTRLIEEGDSALEDLLRAHPGADRTLLRQLTRQARKEKELAEQGKRAPPQAQRSLFRALRALLLPDTGGATPVDGDEDAEADGDADALDEGDDEADDEEEGDVADEDEADDDDEDEDEEDEDKAT